MLAIAVCTAQRMNRVTETARLVSSAGFHGLLFLATLTDCSHGPGSPGNERNSVDGAASVDAPIAAHGVAQPSAVDAGTGLAPLGGEWIERWTMPSGATVFVTRPQGATSVRPVVIAVHGAEDRADWACSEWRATTAGFAWVLCPQGVPLRSGYAWSSAEAIAKQAAEARDALQLRYGAYVAPGPALYGGFSQGASLAASVVAAHPAAFDRVVMVEAGHTPLSPSSVILALKKGGVRRAAISCSTRGCEIFSAELVRAARVNAYELLTNDVEFRGHVFDGTVIKSLGKVITRLVADDPRYDGFAEAAVRPGLTAECCRGDRTSPHFPRRLNTRTASYSGRRWWRSLWRCPETARPSSRRPYPLTKPRTCLRDHRR